MVTHFEQPDPEKSKRRRGSLSPRSPRARKSSSSVQKASPGTLSLPAFITLMCAGEFKPEGLPAPDELKKLLKVKLKGREPSPEEHMRFEYQNAVTFLEESDRSSRELVAEIR